MSTTLFYAFFGGILGAILGSYIGSAYWRIFNHQSLSGRSFCPNCKELIPGYLNIPIFSFFFLRGKSACCQQPLSWSYLMFESLGLCVGALIGGLFGLWGIITYALVVVLGSLLLKAIIR